MTKLDKSAPVMRVRLRLSTASLIALVPGAALRIYPIHRPYLGLELQEMFPKNAIIALVHGDWRPFGLHQGSALLDDRKTGMSLPLSPWPAAKILPAAASRRIHSQLVSPRRYRSAAMPVQ